MVFAKTGLFSPTPWSLSSRRSGPGHHLCFDCWHSPFEQDQDSPGQWCLSADHRFKKVSLCQQFKAIPQTNPSQGHSEHQQSSRPIQAQDVLFTQTSDQPSVRLRFFCAHSLRQIDRGSRSRLQSTQKRGSFLPSVALFRISFQRLLAWSLKTWKRLYLVRCSRISQRMSQKSSPWHLSDSSTSRFRFFRSQIYRTPRPGRHWLCDCSQDDSSHQKQNREPSLSPVQEKLGSGRV